ncbi:hypothetical protein [Bordetella genomosp. 1]|uniref:hypothetical protein n=1 Tax=Bordetella genomosp. 1 TaxID=1395607 RepID=UPI001594F195|nr:hypothetical protein [Bordetella genomosp. 1]
MLAEIGPALRVGAAPIQVYDPCITPAQCHGTGLPSMAFATAASAALAQQPKLRMRLRETLRAQHMHRLCHRIFLLFLPWIFATFQRRVEIISHGYVSG